MIPPKIVVIVPFRNRGDPNRRDNLHCVLRHLNAARLGDVVVCSDGREGDVPFNRSAAYNQGIDMYPPTPGLVYIFHEADMIVPHQQLRAAVDLATWQGTGLVVPFSAYHYLSQADSVAVRNGADPASFEAVRKMTDGTAVGAVNVVSAETMAAVGRWDESFEGWGFDDRAMARAFEVVTGSSTAFARGFAWHLYHTPGWAKGTFAGGTTTLTARDQRATEANRLRFKRYQAATTTAEIRALTCGA